MLLHMVCCALTSGEKLIYNFNVFFVWHCVVNLDGISCVYMRVSCANGCVVVLDWYLSCIFQVWCIGSGCTDACIVPV